MGDKDHECKEDRSCICSPTALEPDEDCPVHGYPPFPRKCVVCGKYLKTIPDNRKSSSFVESLLKGKDECLAVVNVVKDCEDEILRLREERDEADRRAGAAERSLSYLQDSENARKSWLSDAKKAWGYHDNVSFDVIWAEALALKKEKNERV